MKFLLPLVYALTAAVGNAMFALGQRQSAEVPNGLAIVAISTLITVMLALFSSIVMGPPTHVMIVREHSPALALSGIGLFLTLLGFNLLYARYGATYYVLYAALSIVTTALVIGVLWFKEPFNLYHKIALACAIAAVILFSLGNERVR